MPGSSIRHGRPHTLIARDDHDDYTELGALPPLLRLILPHHWVWRWMTPKERREQIQLDQAANVKRIHWEPVVDPTLDRAAEYLSDERVLDVGAGAGGSVKTLLAWGCQVTALEPIPALVARGKAAYPQALWLTATWEAATGLPRFPGILSAYMLHHVADRDGFIRWAAAHLEPGGEIILVEPRHHWKRALRLTWKWLKAYRRFTWQEYGVTHHFLTSGEVRRLARISGLHVTHRELTPSHGLWVLG